MGRFTHPINLMIENSYLSTGQIKNGSVHGTVQKAEITEINNPRYDPKTDYKFINKISKDFKTGNAQSLSWYHFVAGPVQI